MTKRQAHSFEDATHTLHLNFLLTAHLEALLRYLFAQLEDTFNKCLRTWGTTRDIDIHRHDCIDALDGVIAIVKFTARVGTLAHAENPLRLWHLLPQQTQARSHLDRDSPGYNHQVSLARTRAKDLRAKARKIVVRLRAG